MNRLLNLPYAGVTFAKNKFERRSILLSNLISLILFGFSIILFGLYYWWYGNSVITMAIPGIGFLALLCILLNATNHSLLGRTWMSLMIPVTVMTLSIYSKIRYYDQQEELDYFTFRFVILACCIFPALFFSFREKAFLIITSCLCFLILMLHDPLHNAFGVPYHNGVLKFSSYGFTNIVVFITYSILCAGVYFLKWLSERNEERSDLLIVELNNINEQLTEKNTEIEAQNLEISAQTEKLNVNQNQLQQAYTLIEEHKNILQKQNESLSNELVEKNSELTQTNSELIKHNNELRQFSYTVSHNLRAPVASLLGLIKFIDEKSLNRSDGEIFHHIKLATYQLDAIIKDLNKIIDIRHDIFQIRQKIKLVQEIEDVTTVLKRDIENHKVEIVTDLHDGENIYSVKPMVHSILYNLISNAIKYRAAERNPIVQIKSRETKSHFVIDVIDNGIGLDIARNKENLFKLYKRFHYHTEGKGIGLYLAKLQAEALGGTIEVESEMNRFTKFTVSLHKPENIERQILYRQAYAEIFYDARLNCIGVFWQGPVSSEQYRNVFTKCLEFVKAYNTPNYCADLSHQGHIEKADQQWMFSEIMTDAARHGLKTIAAVKADANDTHVRNYLKDISENLKRLGIDQQYFLSMEEAMEWIQQKNENTTLGLTA